MESDTGSELSVGGDYVSRGSGDKEGLHTLVAGQQQLRDQLADVLEGQRAAAGLLADIQRNLGRLQQGDGGVRGASKHRPSRELAAGAAQPDALVGDGGVRGAGVPRPSRVSVASAFQPGAPAGDGKTCDSPASPNTRAWRRRSSRPFVPAVRPQFTGRHRGQVSRDVHEGRMFSNMSSKISDFPVDDAPGPRAPSRSCMLDPLSRPRICFDLLSLAFLCYDMLATPVVLAWGVSLDGFIKYATYLTTSFWLLDIFVHFRTGIFRGGDLEMRPRQVARRYFMTMFWLDASLVCIDVVTLLLHELNWDVSTNMVKLVRIAKVTRIFRITGVIRMVHLIEMVDRHQIQRFVQGASLTAEVFRILAFILYLNHVIACAWWSLGSYAPSDTDFNWVDTSIFSASDTSYEESVPSYQYLTSIHWTLSQMTPGSMQVVPVNSFERVFNVICLLFGLITFSSLISMVSSKMTNFRMQKQGHVRMLTELDQFLRGARITSQLARQIYRQVRTRAAQKRVLNFNELTALQYVSAKMRTELRFEYCQGHLTSHPFFRVVDETREGLLRNVCRRAVETVYMQMGDTLFDACSEACSAYAVMSGSLDYTQSPLTSQVEETTVTHVSEGQWICEVALWCTWMTVGTVDASTPCELLIIQADKCADVLARNPLSHELAQEYAVSFHARLAAACPPESTWPTDLQVPDTEFDDIVLAAPQHIQAFVGLVGVGTLKRQQWMGHWSWAWSARRLEQEVREGKSTVVVTRTGEIRRLTAVVAIRITDGMGRVFAQLGRMTFDGNILAACALPGTKIREGEVPSDTLRRVLEGHLKPFVNSLQFDGVEKAIEERASDRYRIKTRYVRHIHSATLVGDFSLPHAVSAAPAIGAAAAKGARGCCARRAGRHSLPKGTFPSEVFVLADGPVALIGAWLHHDELQCISCPSNRHRLQDFLDSLDVPTAELDACVGLQGARDSDCSTDAFTTHAC